MASELLKFQPKQSPEGCAGQTRPIPGVFTSKLTDLIGCGANILVPDTNPHDSGVYDLTSRGCSGSENITKTIMQVDIMLCLIRLEMYMICISLKGRLSKL